MRIAEPLRLDILARETMGKAQDGAFEALLAANPGMAAEGPFLVAPRDVVVPETPAAPAAPSVNPWD
ncbi:tail protein X [Methylosinus sp. Sm6]|uniref:tail protein X n=1 Tax=Methylosinus sp. Sm6 TaxID=2866948 RepID=UPI001D2FBDA7|nr:tail protein X [Methylosinus sp. Sm6]MBY6243729.1 tail protein X [Methylosinus sp. Sm6]